MEKFRETSLNFLVAAFPLIIRACATCSFLLTRFLREIFMSLEFGLFSGCFNFFSVCRRATIVEVDKETMIMISVIVINVLFRNLFIC